MDKIEGEICPNCNTSFDCGGQCWCVDYPPIIEVTPNNGCFCPNCMHELVVERISVILNDLTKANLSKIMKLGPVNNPIKDIDYTISPSGDKEFTQWYKLRNGII